MSIDKAIRLAHYSTQSRKPKMGWSWGQGLMGGAMAELDEYLNAENSTEFLKGFCDYYVANPPSINSSDTSAPAFITYAMQKKTNNEEYKKLTDRVLNYIQTEPRLIECAVNHHGTNLVGKLYPKSIWVDSLMMFSVFPAQYGKENEDSALLDIAACQVGVFAKYLMDKEDDLWYHSYWTKIARHYPLSKIYWARGNAWVISALPKILDCIGTHPERDNIIKILKDTSKALIKYQNEDGSFNTVLNRKTYRELSATALIADGWLRAVRQGYLPEEYREAALKAYKAVDDAIIFDKDKVFMPEISGPTSPMFVCPYLVYKYTPKGKNLAYGVAAYIWASIEYDRLIKGN